MRNIKRLQSDWMLKMTQSKLMIGRHETTCEAMAQWITWHETKVFFEFLGLWRDCEFDKLKVALLAGQKVSNVDVLQATLMCLNQVKNISVDDLKAFDETEKQEEK